MKRNKVCKDFFNDKGQSLVEFALILPLLSLLILGTLDIGLGFKTYISLTNAAREGVRWISIYPTGCAGAMTRIQGETASVGLFYGDISDGGYNVTFLKNGATVSPSDCNYTADDRVTVSIHYDYQLLFGAIPGLTEIPFEARSTMVVLYDE